MIGFRHDVLIDFSGAIVTDRNRPTEGMTIALGLPDRALTALGSRLLASTAVATNEVDCSRRVERSERTITGLSIIILKPASLFLHRRRIFKRSNPNGWYVGSRVWLVVAGSRMLSTFPLFRLGADFPCNYPDCNHFLEVTHEI